MRLLVCLITAALSLSTSGYAQTVIVADTAPEKATGTIVTQSGNRTMIDGGTLTGRNLFHSLSAFSLRAGDTAAWTFSFGDPVTIRNVISRVTGGERSFIDGTIDSTALPNANFFLINPAGIVLAENAQVNVPAGAHFAAASDLQFVGGGRFSAVTPGGSTFSMANPASFGFLGTEGAIAVLGTAASRPIVAAGQITLAGRDVTIANRSLSSVTKQPLSVAGGIRLLAAGSNPNVLPLTPPTTGQTLAGGQLSLTNARLFSQLNTISADAGDIRVTASRLGVESRVDGFDNNILLVGSRSISIDSSSLDAQASGGAGSGFISLMAPIIAITGGSALISDQNGTGFGGFIVIRGDAIRIADSAIRSRTTGSGDAGFIAFEGRSVSIGGKSVVETTSLAGGLAGSIQIKTSEAITLSGNAVVASNNFRGQSFMGRSGLIRLAAPTITMTGNAVVSSSSFGTGVAGDIGITADRFIMDGGRIALTASGSGRAGVLEIAAATISLANNALISSDTSGSGSAGSISLQAKQAFTLERGVTISSSTSGQGNAGSIAVAADSVALDRSAIRTVVAAGARGGAGDIGIRANTRIFLNNGSQIASSNDGVATDAASAGTISLAGRDILLSNGSQITTNAALGPAGAIRFDMPTGGIVRLRGGPLGAGTITTSSGPGTGGIITIANPLAIISQGGNILALGQQAGANVVIRSQFYIDAADTADLIRVDGNFTFAGQLDYIASGEEPKDLSLLDAGAVLAGRCRAARAKGRSSQLGIASVGPYGAYEMKPDSSDATQLFPSDPLAGWVVARPCG